MSDGETVETGGAGPATVGQRLRAAREAQGLSTADIAARTRVTQRYLEAIENNRPQDLPSSTYAVGFAKAYARAVGMDQVAIGHDIRNEITAPGAAQRTHHHVQEIADPARGPSRGLVIVAAGLALAVLVLGALWFAAGTWRGASDRSAPESTPSVSSAVPAPARPTPVASGPVVLIANDEVWMRVYDAADKTLYLGTMKPGERFEVPAGADDPKINVGRPDKLSITVGGRSIAPLGDGSHAIKDVRIGAAALAPRLDGNIALVPSPSPSPSASATASTTRRDDGDRPSRRERRAANERRRSSDSARAPASGGDEVRRANENTPRPAASAATPPGVTTP